MTLVKKYLWVLFISMVPVIELRGAIPVGVSLGLPLWVNFALCVAGNFLPVPFILHLHPPHSQMDEGSKAFG